MQQAAVELLGDRRRALEYALIACTFGHYIRQNREQREETAEKEDEGERKGERGREERRKRVREKEKERCGA
jgi:hypothetical protein